MSLLYSKIDPERNMSNHQTDGEWWDLQDDHHSHDDGQMLLLQNYQIATPLDHDHAGRHNAKLFTRAPQYPETANIQYEYPISSTTTSVSPENLMKRPTHVLTSPAKPKRRRGRGGAMAVTTFLNSTMSNFRELVQQHTGMRSISTSPSSYYGSCVDQKGPITLCFANYSSSSSTSESAVGFINRNQ